MAAAATCRAHSAFRDCVAEWGCASYGHSGHNRVRGLGRFTVYIKASYASTFSNSQLFTKGSHKSMQLGNFEIHGGFKGYTEKLDAFMSSVKSNEKRDFP